jgi:hypothetical protein
MLWYNEINNINKNSKLQLQVYVWKILIVYITQQDAPHKDKIRRIIMFMVSRSRPVRRADNLTAIC